MLGAFVVPIHSDDLTSGFYSRNVANRRAKTPRDHDLQRSQHADPPPAGHQPRRCRTPLLRFTPDPADVAEVAKGACIVGASTWDYFAPFKGDALGSVSAFQQELFDSGATCLDGDLEEWGLARPASLEELWNDEEFDEYQWGEGSHSLLDVPPDRMTPLGDDDARRLFGTDRPTRGDFERVAGENAIGVMDEVTERWTGRYVVLYVGGVPAEVAIWGYSGD